jgi:hypothetical protein
MEYFQIPVNFVTHLGAMCLGMMLVAVPIGIAVLRMWKQQDGED